MANTPKTKQELNNLFRASAGRGSVTSGQTTDAEMNEWLRSRGTVIPEKKKPVRQLTPEEAVEVMEMMNGSGMTFAQAKAKLFEAQEKEASTSRGMNTIIRKKLGLTVDEDEDGQK